MQEKRKRQRVIPPDFRDFNVQLKQGDLTMNGSLGNISESGMLALIPGGAEPPIDTEVEIAGSIHSKRLQSQLFFRARRAWSEVRELHHESYQFIGMQFVDQLTLPDALIAFELAAEISE